MSKPTSKPPSPPQDQSLVNANLFIVILVKYLGSAQWGFKEAVRELLKPKLFKKSFFNKKTLQSKENLEDQNYGKSTDA